jgi:hypothetical protein
MEAKAYAIIFLLVATGFALGYLTGSISSSKPEQTQTTIPTTPQITGEVIREESKEYTYTTAICNESNECIDVLVECEGGNVISLTPVSELLELGDDFEDFRDPPEEFCE